MLIAGSVNSAVGLALISLCDRISLAQIVTAVSQAAVVNGK